MQRNPEGGCLVKNQTVIWDEVTIPMKDPKSIEEGYKIH